MCFSSLVSHDGPKSLKNYPNPSKIPSLLSAHAGIYITKPPEPLQMNLFGEQTPDQPHSGQYFMRVYVHRVRFFMSCACYAMSKHVHIVFYVREA